MDETLAALLSILLTKLSSIPNIVWSGVFAALIALTGALLSSALTLGGVLLSNRSNTTRLRMQLAHDAGQKAQDRLAALRKEVYLEAAAETMKVNAFFGKIPSLDPLKENIGDGLADFLALSAKLQLIAGDETVRLVAAQTSRYGETFLQLLSLSTPVHDARQDVVLHTGYFERYRAEVNQILDEMRLLNESGHPDAARFAALQRSVAATQGRLEHHAKLRSEAHERQHAGNIRYQIGVLERMLPIAKGQVDVTVALRAEIGLKSDAEAYHTILEDNRARMETALEHLISTLRASEEGTAGSSEGFQGR